MNIYTFEEDKGFKKQKGINPVVALVALIVLSFLVSALTIIK